MAFNVSYRLASAEIKESGKWRQSDLEQEDVVLAGIFAEVNWRLRENLIVLTC